MDLSDRVVQLLLGIDSYLAASDVTVDGRPWRAVLDGKSEEDIPQPPWEWLCLVMETAASLLGASIPCSVRQFIDNILINVQVANEGANVLMRMRRVLKAKRTPLLELDCDTVAAILIDVAKRLRAKEQRIIQAEELGLRCALVEERRTRKKMRALKKKIKQLETGSSMDEPQAKQKPVPFVYGSKEHKFPAMQSLLLHFLTHDWSDHRRIEGAIVEERELLWLLWRRNKAGKKKLQGRLENLQFKTNATLQKHQLPLKIVRPEHNRLQLKFDR